MQSTTMTINLRKKLINLHTARRRKRVVGLVKEAVARFSKSDIGKIKIHHELNEFLEKNASGVSFLWTRLKLKVDKSDDKVEVKLYSAKAAPVSAAAPKAEEKGKAAKKA